jgi:lipopolysaccharide transport system ATP-binding protein
MNDTVIRIDRLGKKYRIRHQRRESYTALRDVLSERIRRVFQPCSTQKEELPESEDFWALKDVSFEVRRGEVLGVIGRNGAGKSTLLKILSRITDPSAGRVELNGRASSLLEVGTGFHPELTGRENIYLNGAILGMTRAEIGRKFDEIVAFAEIAKFLDTPVKRYSSGMYLRLAFAVAAHMEPEILIVDEVLAVGDAEFQKKCLGKMHDVSKSGRTVLFVSHNMAAVKSLTTRGIVLDSGQLSFVGPTEQAIVFYAQSALHGNARRRAQWGRGTHTTIRSARLIDARGQTTRHYLPSTAMEVEILFETDGEAGLSIEAFLLDAAKVKIGLASLYQFHGQNLPLTNGAYCCRLKLNPIGLASGWYSIDLTTSVVNSNWDHYVEAAIDFEVPFSNPHGRAWDFRQSYGYGALALLCEGGATITPVADIEKQRERARTVL